MGTKAAFLQRVLVLLASVGLIACNGGGDFGTGGGDEEVVIVPIIGTVVSNSFQPQTVGIEPQEIASGGTTLLTVEARWSDTGDLIIQPLNIEFSSQCGSEDPPRAVITPQLQIQAGVYQAEYEATGCTGDDVVVVNLDGVVAATAVVSILSPEVGTIQFVSADPERIALSGFGSEAFPEFSDVTFRVLDAAGLPVPGRTVSFALTNTIGGVSLVNAGDESDQAGDVVARVQSGIINTTVRVVASYTAANGVDVQTISGPIAINSGLADQDSFDIATSVFNPLAFDYNYPLDAAPVEISVYAADSFNNPVPDGSQITFVTENGGQIQGNCATVNGACSVPWASSGDRPANGIVTIVARIVGEESFADANGNGLFDLGELGSVGQRPEAFLDANESRFGLDASDPESAGYDPGETFFDFNTDGRYTFENNLYDGAGCSEAAQAAGHCAELIEARQSITLVLSGSALSIDTDRTSVNLSKEGESICYAIYDQNDNIPPAGTAVTITTTLGNITSGNTSFSIPNTSYPGAAAPYEDCVTVSGTAGGGDVVTGELRISATVPEPSGVTWEQAVRLSDTEEAAAEGDGG